jgi:YidC/Oxa1 family membrane protein insertase
MEAITFVFNEILYRPIFNLLVWTYNVIPGHDLGIAIILVTLFLRVILYPPSHKALKAQKALQDLQPQLKEIQAKYKEKEARAKAMMEFYKEHHVNPLSGCLPLLIQLPILFALYKVFLTGLNHKSLEALYPFIQTPETLNPMFLGVVDLQDPSRILAVLAGVSQFLQGKSMYAQGARVGSSSPSDFSNMMSKQMIYMMPLFMVFIAWKLPAGLALYWVVTTLFSLGQQMVINKSWKIRLF